MTNLDLGSLLILGWICSGVLYLAMFLILSRFISEQEIIKDPVRFIALVILAMAVVAIIIELYKTIKN